MTGGKELINSETDTFVSYVLVRLISNLKPCVIESVLAIITAR